MILFKTRKKCSTLLHPTFQFLVQLSIFGLLQKSYGASEGKAVLNLQKRSTWSRRHGESDFDTFDDPYGDRPYYDLKTNLKNGNGYRSSGPEPEDQHDHNDQKYGISHIDKGSPLTDDQVVYVGCIDAWFGLVRDQFFTAKFDMNMDYIQCATFCKSQRPPCQISFLRGGECKCHNNFYPNPTDLLPDYWCNVPCPVTSSKTFLEDETTKSCGGNRYYSVYCHEATGETQGTFCTSLRKPREAKMALAMKLFPDIGDREIGSLRSQCASCGNQKCNAPIFSPSYDYFPRNKPHDPDGCNVFCSHSVTYTHRDREGQLVQAIRPATKYALLLWHNDPKNLRPICQCTDDISNYVEEDPSICTSPCPGNDSFVCGEVFKGWPVLATIYCVKEDCSEQSSTPQPPEEHTSTSEEYQTGPTSTSEKAPEPDIPTTVPVSSTVVVELTTPTTTTETPKTTTTIMTTTTAATTTTTITKSTSEPPLTIDCYVSCFGVEIRTGQAWSVCGGEQIRESCGPNSKGVWTWKCLNNGQFETDQPDYSDCHSDWIEKIEEEVKTINDTKSTLEYLAGVKKAIDERVRSPYFGHEITNVTGVLDVAVRKAYEFTNTSEQFEEVVLGVINVTESLIETRKPWFEIDSKSRSTSSTSLLGTIERTSLKLTSKVKLPSGEFYEKQLTRSSPADPEYFVSAGIIPKQIGNDSNDPFTFPHARLIHSSYIYLPVGWKKLVQTDNIEHVGHFINAEIASLLLPGQYNKLVSASASNDYISNPSNQKVKMINGNLMSLTIGSSPSNSIKSMQNGTIMTNGITGRNDNDDDNRINIRFRGKGVQITFEHDVEAWGADAVDIRRKLHAGETRKAALGTAECVYWDTKDLIWSTQGCKVVSKTRYRTICECNHLTSFAVLMDAHNYMGKDMGLEILTLVLCSLSFISLFASIIMFSVIRGVQNLRTTITLNLSVCLLLGNTLVLLVVDRNYFNLADDVCVATGIITHYVFLSAFSWMIIEGIHLYKMVVYVFDTERNPINIYRLVAYGLPLLTVAATVTIGYLKGDRPYGGDVVCWLEGKYIWSFLVPVAIVVMVNFVILFVALKTAYQLQHNSAIPVHQKRVRSSKTWIKGCFSITVLLGLTWLVGYFTLVPSSPGLIAAYIFTLLNASQGIFIFVFHCLLNEKVQAMTNKRFGNYLPSWFSVSQDSANETSGFGKRTVSNMQASSFSARNPRFAVGGQNSINSTTTAATAGSQSSQGPKSRPKFPDSDLNRDGVSMDATGGESYDKEISFVVTPKLDKKTKHLRKRDSSGTMTSGDWSPANHQSDSDRSFSSLRSLLTLNKPRNHSTNPSN